MKLTRTFSLTAKNGQIRYSTGPVVPFPVRIKSLKLMADDPAKLAGKEFEITHNGTVILSGTGRPGEDMELDEPFRLSIGKQFFKVIAKPFNDGDLVEGQVEIRYSIF
ncbi:MAG TPA: hypothetical protein VL202_03185 [Pararhizobium sp.]|uniref:hypothetical protein n=1 Tax=Pararhizobium sp. TaxID=1977563 RepID=UPI002C32C5B3|nr:hypothetical protein [Pararhizobium sp.]HTO30175.1 hypothetical protein [Pararhizobium sp.]